MSNNWRVFQTIGEWKVYHPDVTVDVPTVFPCTGLVDTDGYSHVFDVEDAQVLLDARPRPEITWHKTSDVRWVAKPLGNDYWELVAFASGHWEIQYSGDDRLHGKVSTVDEAKVRATKLWWAIVDAEVPL